MHFDGHDIHIVESGQDVEFEDTTPPREKMQRYGDSLWYGPERHLNLLLHALGVAQLALTFLA